MCQGASTSAAATVSEETSSTVTTTTTTTTATTNLCKLFTMADLIVAIKGNRFTDVSRRLTQESKHNLKILINYQDRDSHETMLFCACIKGHLRLAKFLLDRGARVDLTTCWGAAPIHAASEKGHVDLVRLLLSYGSGVNWQTSYGDTPLHLASYRGQYEVVKCLVETGCDIGLVNSKGKTAAGEANNSGNRRIVQYLTLLMATENQSGPMESRSAEAMCTRQLEPPVRQHPTTSTIKITTWHSNHHSNDCHSTNELKRPQTWELPANHNTRHKSRELRPDTMGNDLSSDFRSTEKCNRREIHQNVVQTQIQDKDTCKQGFVSYKPAAKTDHRHTAEQRDAVGSDRQRMQSLERAVSDLQQGLVMTQEELARTQAELKETQKLLYRFKMVGCNNH